MFRLVVFTCALVALAAGQAYVDPKNAKILKEQRFNAGDGRTGSAFATEDGVIFREEADIDGNRIGQYSYIGDDGQTYTVKYSAGKDGFRILDGSHVPSSGQDAASFNPDFVAEEEAVFVEEPLPAPVRQAPRRPAPRQEPLPLPQQNIPRSNPAFLQQRDENPFINPHDPTHRNFQFNKNAARFDPDSPLTQQLNLVPDCAGCKGVNPFINPHDPTHQSGGVLAGHLAGFGVPQSRPVPRAQPAPRPRPATPQRPARIPVSQPAPREFTTEPTRRFFPPGELKLNRFETGFNFDFES